MSVMMAKIAFSHSLEYKAGRVAAHIDDCGRYDLNRALYNKYGKSEEDYPTAFTDGDGSHLVQVGRVRKDLWDSKRLNLWVVADNLLKGAALNSIQIASLLFD